MKFRDKFAGLVGPDLYRHALFYKFPGGLRFALSNGGSPLEQVLTALEKASVICSDAFSNQSSILVHLQKYAPSSRFQLRHTLRELALAGLTIPACRQVWLERVTSEEPDDDGNEEIWINLAFAVPKSKLKNLLWCALVADFGALHPNPQCLVYLINPEQEMLVHPYDDRGMDVIGKQHAALQNLFNTYKAWLLEHDIETMKQTFMHPQ